MDTAEFLARVLPEGNGYIAWPSDKIGSSGKPLFSHSPFDEVSSALAKARNLEGKAKDTYFAVASFKVQKILDTEKGYMKAFRKQENVSRLKCLFFDIDFKAYQTEVDAANALKSFLTTTRIPKPTIVVNSGGGLHVYWVFDRALTPDEWKPLAVALAALGQKTGLKADYQCTIDSARVLRVPGTLNFKYSPPRRCHIVTSRPDNVAYEAMRDFLVPHAEAVPKQGLRVSADVVNLFGDSTEDLRANYEAGATYMMSAIVEKCPTIADVLARHGAGDVYSFWKDVLHLAAYTSDGADYIHELSRGHADYTPEEVESRYQESVKIREDGSRGPTTCARFSEHSAACLNCSYWGHIKSPISLGLQLPAKKPDDISYVIADKTYMNIQTDDGIVERKLICNTGLQDWRYGEDHAVGAFLQFTATAPGMHKRVTVECSQLGDPRYLRSHLAAQSIPIYPEQLKWLERVMYSWLERLRDRGDQLDAAPAFGWTYHPNTKEVSGFAYSGEVYLRNGQRVLGGLVDTSLESSYGVSGKPEPWREIANRLVQDPRDEIQVILATAFAAPLMRFNQAGSFIVSAYSRQSGVGKSTALACAQAVWGHPIKAANSLNDTAASIARKLSQIRDLPSYWDELRMKDQVEAFVRLVFQIYQGKERQRLNSNARLRKAEEINTFLCVATNEPLMGAMLEHTKLSDAGAMRLFEFPVPRLPGEALDTDFGRLLIQLREHHGHAGLTYANYLVSHYDDIIKVLAAVDAVLVKELNPRPQERFWYQGVSCLIVGAILAQRAGIVQIDPKRILNFCRSRFSAARQAIEAETAIEDELVAAILGFFANDVLVTELTVRSPGGGGTRGWINNVVRPPRANLVRAQIGIRDRVIWIPLTALDLFASNSGMNPISLRETLKQRFGARRRRVTPGAGTSYSLGQVSVMELPASSLGPEGLSRWASSEEE